MSTMSAPASRAAASDARRNVGGEVGDALNLAAAQAAEGVFVAQLLDVFDPRSSGMKTHLHNFACTLVRRAPADVKARARAQRHPFKPWRLLTVRQRLRQHRRVAALITFAESIDRPLRPMSKDEIAREIRVLEDMFTRRELAIAAGMAQPDDDTRVWSSFKRQLTPARRELKFERGDY